jgi:hypothetical protein
MHSDVLARRALLKSAACGFGGLALAGLAAGQAQAASVTSPWQAKPTLFPARAKRVIFIFMQGGPSHVDTFDYKPRLAEENGKKLAFKDARKLAKTGMSGSEIVMQSPWAFKQYGECGRWVSDLFPSIAQHVDDLTFVHSLHTNGVAHGPATIFLHTGTTNFVRPSMGAWISYGLGNENENLPSFVTINPSLGNGGPRNYGNAFLPAHYQGTTIGRAGQPAKDARIQFITNDSVPFSEQKRQLELLSSLNADQLARRAHDDELSAVVSSYEMAFRMQMHAPEITDISRESKATQDLYGIGEKETDEFGQQCLLARRMSEAGCRFVQVSYADNTANPRWDQHSKIQLHATHAQATDRPVAGLLADLKARGLLDDTLVWWGGEFGRNPFTQGADGRDHNPKGFTHFFAGGGMKRGFSYGATDEFGHEAVVDKMHMHDVHATILHALGMDHEKLTYRHAGRDFRLTDVEGRVVKDLFV